MKREEIEKPEKRIGGKTRPQQIINGAYNQGLEDSDAYHLQDLRERLERLKLPECLSNNYFNQRIDQELERIKNELFK